MKLTNFLLIVPITIFAALGLRAQDAPKTTANPTLDAAHLEHQLVPLQKGQLEAEVKGWIALVEAKATEIAARKIANEDASSLTRERDALIDRTNLAIAALDAKGGEVGDSRKYIATVQSVVGIDVTDAGAVWTAVVDWVQSADGGLKWLINIALFLVTVLIFKFIANLVGKIMGRSLETFGKTSGLLRNFFVNATKKIVMFVGVVIGLSILGVDIGPFLAAMGAAGFIIGFALQGTLSNFAAGIMILLYRPYDVGEVVTVGGATGKVIAMTLVSTTVLTPDNQRVIVPNNAIWGGVITNITGSATRRVDLVFGIGYEDDMAKAQKILEEVVTAHPKVHQDPAPVIRLHELADSSVNYVVRPWTNTGDYWDVYWDLTRTVKERFDAEGVSIPFPQRDVHVHQVAS